MMSPAPNPRWRVVPRAGFRRLGVVSLLAGALLAMSSLPAAAIDFFDGRIETHGYYEQDIRSLWQNLSPSNRWDLSQWQHILDLETDLNIAPDGWGPFDSVTGFTRIEVRFDCIWTRGCGLFGNADMYGDRSSSGTLADRAANGRRLGYVGAQFTGDQDPYLYRTPEDLDKDHFNGGQLGRPRGVLIWNTATVNVPFQGGLGPDGIRGSFQNPGDDPSWPLYAHFFGGDGEKCLFSTRKVKAGNPAGFVVHDMPWNPGCNIQPHALLQHYPNPWNPNDPNLPVLGAFSQATGTPPVGTGGLPFRPAPVLAANSPGNAQLTQAQGVYYPTETLARRMANHDFGAFDQNYSQSDLQWNHGASQSETYELREAYLDLEMFDSRLWLRAGKQEIVWGKTELFRNQDRFNPQDLAISTLPTLEESRIPLWALRGVWSFYEVGPFSDVRLEGALDLNDFQPNDLGRCGEPYTVTLVCDKTYGLMAHGFTGLGLEGEMRPPRIFHSWSSLQGGARLEWRYDRFSFALTDYYGFNPSPITPVDFHYSRNVDPVSGRPRLANASGPCRTGTEASCLIPNPGSPNDPALARSQLNQTVYAWLCANAVGLVAGSVGATDCPIIGLFNSQAPTASGPLALVLNEMMAGGLLGRSGWSALSECGTAGPPFAPNPGVPGCSTAVQAQLAVPLAEQAGLFGTTPIVALSRDGGETGAPGAGLDAVLSPEQQALVGCGPFYMRDCDTGAGLGPLAGQAFPPGIDLLNAEASVLLQSFDSFEGTLGVNWSTLDTTRWQPGTIGFQGGPVGTRYAGNLQTVQLPGARGPGDPGYNPLQDGGLCGPDGTGTAHSCRAQPFTGQAFKSEMAVLSWNLQMMLAALQVDPTGQNPQEFDPNQPFAMGRCSLAQPQFCIGIVDLMEQAMITRPTVKAGGSGKYGRFDFLWATGYEQYVDYPKTNVLGFSTDFAEDRTKTNWGVEFTWENNLPVANLNSADQITNTDLFNLTISVDRPTFINFLNANRTFFINSQLFIQYVSNYQKGFQMEGPFNFLGTIAINTGYFQDRLLPALTLVWDFNSNSGGLLSEVQYRFTENFSTTFGVNLFGGYWDRRNGGISDAVDRIAVTPQGQNSYVQNGLSPVEDRDEIYIKIRYTF